MSHSPRTFLSGALLLSLVPGCFIWDVASYRIRLEQRDSSSFSLANGGRVELQTFNGRIEVRGEKGSLVRIDRIMVVQARTEGEATLGFEKLAPQVKSEEGLLSYRIEDPHERSRHYEVHLIVTVPDGSRLTLRTVNGPVEVSGVAGSIDARTANGKISARDGGRDEIHLHTSNGKILAEDLSGSVEAHTTNGHVIVRRCRGRIEVHSSNGPVDIEAAPGAVPEEILAETSNGRVSCRLPGSYQGDIDVQTRNGRVRTNFPVTVERGSPEKGRLRGRIGGGGPLLRLSTSNGSIEIHRSGERIPIPTAPEPVPPDDGESRKV